MSGGEPDEAARFSSRKAQWSDDALQQPPDHCARLLRAALTSADVYFDLHLGPSFLLLEHRHQCECRKLKRVRALESKEMTRVWVSPTRRALHGEASAQIAHDESRVRVEASRASEYIVGVAKPVWTCQLRATVCISQVVCSIRESQSCAASETISSLRPDMRKFQ